MDNPKEQVNEIQQELFCAKMLLNTGKQIGNCYLCYCLESSNTINASGIKLSPRAVLFLL